MFLRLHFLIIIQHEHNSNVLKNAFSFSFHENNRCIKTCLHPPARENICETNNFRFKLISDISGVKIIILYL
jgi:hypothetical protein